MALTRPVDRDTLLDIPPSIGMIAQTIRWDVVSPGGDIVDEVKVAGGPSIRFSPLATIARSCSGGLIVTEDLDEINLFRAELQPTLVLEDGNEYPMGRFVIKSSADDRANGREFTSLTLYDYNSLIDQGLQNTFAVTVGGSLYNAQVELLERSGIERYDIPPSGNASTPLIWKSGTSKKQVLDEIALLKGCVQPYFDATGKYICKPLPNLEPGVGFEHNYSLDNSRILSNTIRTSRDLEVPNVHTVINTGPTYRPIVGSAKVDRWLPYSVEARGRKIVKVWRTQGLEDSAAAIRAAQVMAATSGAGFAEIQFSTLIDPRHDGWDRVLVIDDVYLETGWVIAAVTGGAMTHTATRAFTEEDL